MLKSWPGRLLGSLSSKTSTGLMLSMTLIIRNRAIKSPRWWRRSNENNLRRAKRSQNGAVLEPSNHSGDTPLHSFKIFGISSQMRWPQFDAIFEARSDRWYENPRWTSWEKNIRRIIRHPRSLGQCSAYRWRCRQAFVLHNVKRMKTEVHSIDPVRNAVKVYLHRFPCSWLRQELDVIGDHCEGILTKIRQVERNKAGS